MIEQTMTITAILFILIILPFGFDSTEHARDPAGDHNNGLQQINLVAFKDIPRTSHPTKEVVPVIPRVATKFPTHAQ
jgi:hypothetical protein